MSKVPKSEMNFFLHANACIWCTPYFKHPPISNPGSTLGQCAVHSKIVVLRASQAVFPCELDVHRTHTPRCEVKKIIALWRMHAVMQGWKEVGCED